jgi:serine/threonine protein kinase
MSATPEPIDDDMTPADAGLPDGVSIMDGEFTITGRISHGGFGITYLAKDNSLNRTVVIKECFPEAFCNRRNNCSVVVRSVAYEDQYKSIVQMFMLEARSIAKMRHPNIVGVHRVFEDNHTAYMALDLIEGHDLKEIIEDKDRNLTPTQIKDILFKILDAIELVHAHDLLHRDISPDNILLDKWGNPVLIDFGAAREEASKKTRAVSTLMVVKDGYSPQEFYFAGSNQNESSDLYALAATFYHVISGQAPPNSQTRVSEIAMNNPDPCVPLIGSFPGYDDVFLNAIDRAMRIAPRDRFQSVREWVDMIDPHNTHVDDYVRPVVNESLGMTLTSLVSQTNKDLLTIPPTPLKKTPLELLQENTSSDVADWVKEFNDETRNKQGDGSIELDDGPTFKGRFLRQKTIPPFKPMSLDPTMVPQPMPGFEDQESRGRKKSGLNLKLVAAVLLRVAGCFAVLNNAEAVVQVAGL